MIDETQLRAISMSTPITTDELEPAPELEPELAPILITSCSSTRMIAPVIRVGDLPSGLTMQQALERWMQLLNAQPASLTPRELYRGLGFSTLVKIQDQFDLDSVKIITGGQGLIDMDEKIVPYDFTAHPKEPENIHQKVTSEPFVQTVWWKMINTARGKSSSPISELVSKNPGRYVIISASKIFLRYASDDILSIPFDQRSKIRILLTASSLGSVPAQLRPMIIPFDRSSVSDLPGNRNDNNHRAAQKFLEMIANPEFATLNVTQQMAYIESRDGSLPGNFGGGGLSSGVRRTPRADLEKFLKERPHYLNLPFEDAYKMTQRALGTIGGRMYFKSIIRQMNGEMVTSTPTEIENAIEALQALGGAISLEGGSSTAGPEEEAALKGVRAFVEALKALAPRAMFNAADICRWAPVYYQKQSTPVPYLMESPIKLSFILKNNTTILGLEANGKGYTILS